MRLPIDTHEKAINIHQDKMIDFLMGGIGHKTKKQRREWTTAVRRIERDIEPDQHIQYVYVEPESVAQEMLQMGIIKPTKRKGKERFILDKNVVFMTWEPKAAWLSTLSQTELLEYQNAETIELYTIYEKGVSKP